MPEPSHSIAHAPSRHDAVPAVLRRLWRVLLQWRFRLFQRRRYNRLVVEEVAGRPLLVLPQVFNPRLFRTGDFMACTLDEDLIPPQSLVLDMGTGSGIGAVVAARWAGTVDATDVNPHAVRCARINALLNQVEDRITVHRGDLFAPVQGRRFDVVLFNPPYFKGKPHDALDQAWRSDDVVERFAASLQDHLTPVGYALVVLSSDGDREAFLETFRHSGLTATPVAERNLINEVLTMFRLCPATR